MIRRETPEDYLGLSWEALEALQKAIETAYTVDTVRHDLCQALRDKGYQDAVQKVETLETPLLDLPTTEWWGLGTDDKVSQYIYHWLDDKTYALSEASRTITNSYLMVPFAKHYEVRNKIRAHKRARDHAIARTDEERQRWKEIRQAATAILTDPANKCIYSTKNDSEIMRWAYDKAADEVVRPQGGLTLSEGQEVLANE
jgi:hypothetical protein